MDEIGTCLICNNLMLTSENIGIVRSKGLNTFIDKSKQRDDGYWEVWQNLESVTLHETCRKRYSALSANPKKKVKFSLQPEGQIPIEFPSTSSDNDLQIRQKRCSSSTAEVLEHFDFPNLCILCGRELDRKHKRVRSVIGNYEQDRIIDYIRWKNDENSEEIILRFHLLSSQKKMLGYYHEKCRSSTRRVENVDTPTIPNNQIDMIFQKVTHHIENSGEYKFYLSQLQKVMGDTCLSNYTLLKMLKQTFGENICIIRHPGRQPLILYKTFNVLKSCGNWFTDPGSLSDLEKKTILQVAAEILSHDIKNQEYNTHQYPPPSRFLSSVISDIPDRLKTFLNHLLLTGTEGDDEKYIKRDNIAHEIISAIRPKSFVSNLQLAVGTYVYRKTGSRLIVDLLSKLGVSATYYNIQLYEASTIMDPPKLHLDNAFVQFVFDNTDHNVRTLDGHETFHCLGGIAVYTPHYEIEYEGGSKKCTKMPSASILASQKQIPTIPFTCSNSKGLQDISFTDTEKLHFKRESKLLAPTYVTYLCAKTHQVPNTPSWRGFFEVLSREETYSMSHVTCLPFINGPPSNFTTLNSALLYAANETKSCNQKTTFVTFDQPLYYKARSIISQSDHPHLQNVVIRLGGFHLLMSYLGAIGSVMQGSGLEDLWAVVYASESVKKMLSGHAFSRALRAHILSFTAIGIIICKNLDATGAVKEYISNFLGKWTEDPPVIGDCNTDPVMQLTTEKFISELNKLENNGPTAKLWVQYIKMIIIALQFIESERLGNWDLHLQSLQNMLPIFHAAGHFAYAKSVQIYLQDMVNLDAIMDPSEYHLFTTEGYFTIRRSDKAWSGVWSDMVIEQTLNRFFGTDLRHGRGVTASVVARYLVGMPSAFDVMECLENYVDFKSANSEQHVDLTQNRMIRDSSDIEKFVFWIDKHNPFKQRASLMSLSTGIIGGANINCHIAFEKGREGMASIIGKNLENVTLSKVFKVKSFSVAELGMHVNNVECEIDTTLLFQRIAVYFQGNEEKTREALSYELSPYPLSLFDEHGLMRKTAKAELFKIFKPHLESELLVGSFINVIDGGWLLHKVVWPHSKTFKDIFEIYRLYVNKKFGRNSKIVFDGYSSEIIGTKSYERYRRKEKIVAPDVDISEEKMITMTQKKFLSNVANKYKFVELLALYLNKHKITTTIAEEDADTLIVNTAIEIQQEGDRSVAVVGSDVDLFILLIALTPNEHNMFFRKIPPGPKNTQLYSTSDHQNLKAFILFAHAFAGCDSTSSLYKFGKKTIISLLAKNVGLQASVSVFYQPNKTSDEIYPVAEEIIKHLYNTSNQQLTIAQLRYKIYTSSVTFSKKSSTLAVLPPTKSTLMEHAKRVYYQIQLWLGHQLNPEQWGWKRTSFMLIPIMMTEPAGPKSLLQLVFCSCQGNCSTARCGCKKAGLKCSKICKQCNGEICENTSPKLINNAELYDETDEEQNIYVNDDYEHNEDNAFANDESMDIN